MQNGWILNLFNQRRGVGPGIGDLVNNVESSSGNTSFTSRTSSHGGKLMQRATQGVGPSNYESNATTTGALYSAPTN